MHDPAQDRAAFKAALVAACPEERKSSLLERVFIEEARRATLDILADEQDVVGETANLHKAENLPGEQDLAVTLSLMSFREVRRLLIEEKHKTKDMHRRAQKAEALLIKIKIRMKDHVEPRLEEIDLPEGYYAREIERALESIRLHITQNPDIPDPR